MAPALASAGEGLLRGPLVTRLAQGVRSLRGSVLFDNGRRRHFRTEEGRFFDADPIDLYGYHILAYDAMRLIGCVRVYSLVSNHFSCVTEQILGEKTFSEMLHKLGAQRTETIEIGRWIVHPAYRASGRPAVQLAAASAALAITLGNGSLVKRGFVLCSAGTGDRQDLMLARIGLAAVPVTKPIKCDKFKDTLRVMYCINTQQLIRDFSALWMKWRRLSDLLGRGKRILKRTIAVCVAECAKED
jgi:Acetyltransferase (GNAT) domain